eukprot:408714-Amphidinium_carterae.1
MEPWRFLLQSILQLRVQALTLMATLCLSLSLSRQSTANVHKLSTYGNEQLNVMGSPRLRGGDELIYSLWQPLIWRNVASGAMSAIDARICKVNTLRAPSGSSS